MKPRFTNTVTTVLRVTVTLLVLLVFNGQLFAKCDANFSAKADSLTFTFTGAANDSNLTYAWTFGDGNTGSGRIATNKYTKPGTYYVCLTVTDSACNLTHCDSIHVGPPPPPPHHCDAHFTFSNDTSKNGIRFKGANNASSATYAWTFGDGGTSGQQNPTHIYSGPGKYQVCLTVTDSGCSNNFCDSIRVGPPPPPPHHCDAGFSSSPDTSANGIRFKGNKNDSTATYAWTFGDGGTGSGQNVTHTYSGTGTYYVCLTVTDSGCSANHCDSVRVGTKPPPPPKKHECDAHFKHSNGGKNNEVHFDAKGKGPHTHYSWNFGDDSTSTKSNPKHTYANPGTYYVCLTVTDTAKNGDVCTDTFCDSVHVGKPQPPKHHEPCNADFEVKADSVKNLLQFSSHPNDENAAYLWNFGDGSTSTDANAVHQFADSSTYYVCLTITDSGYCSTTKCDSVNVSKFKPHKRMAAAGNFGDGFATVYPNPVTENATIHIENVSDVVSFRMYDVTGKMIFSKDNLTNGNFELNRKDLTDGIYYYEVLDGIVPIGNGKLIVQ